MEELERLKQLKEEALSNPKKSKGCKSCKKKKEVVNELPELVEDMIYVPTETEIKVAYAELTSQRGLSKNKETDVKKIYQYLFNEDLDLNCGSCSSKQAIKWYNWMKKQGYRV